MFEAFGPIPYPQDQMESEWVPAIRQLFNIDRDRLPAIWDADFFYGPGTIKAGTLTCLAINVSAVFLSRERSRKNCSGRVRRMATARLSRDAKASTAPDDAHQHRDFLPAEFSEIDEVTNMTIRRIKFTPIAMLVLTAAILSMPGTAPCDETTSIDTATIEKLTGATGTPIRRKGSSKYPSRAKTCPSQSAA